MRSNCQPNFFSSWDYENQVEDTTGCSSFGLVFDLWLDSYAAVTESPLQRLQTKIVFSTSQMVMSISKEFCFMLVIWFLAASRSNFQNKKYASNFSIKTKFNSKLNLWSLLPFHHSSVKGLIFRFICLSLTNEKIGLACLFGPWKVLVFEICDRIHKFKIQTLLENDNNCNKLHLLSISCHFLKRFLSMHFLSRVHISDKMRSVPDLRFLLVWKTKENRA